MVEPGVCYWQLGALPWRGILSVSFSQTGTCPRFVKNLPRIIRKRAPVGERGWAVAAIQSVSFEAPPHRSTRLSTTLRTCQPNRPDAQPTAVQKWKFDIVQQAILKSLAKDTMVSSRSLPSRMTEFVDDADIERLGNLKWLVEKVRLEMEFRGEIARTTAESGLFVLHLPDINVALDVPAEEPTEPEAE